MQRLTGVLGLVLVSLLPGCADAADDRVVVVTTSEPTSVVTEASTSASVPESTVAAPAAVATPITVAGADSIVVDGNEVWVGSFDGNWVVAFDASTGDEVVSIADVCGRNNGPADVAATDDRAWVACSSGTVVVVDRASRAVEETIDIGSRATSLTVGGGVVWVTDPDEGAIMVIDPIGLVILERIALGNECDRPVQAESFGGSIWIVGPTAMSCGGVTRYTESRIHQIDMAQGGIVWSSAPIPGADVRVAVVDGELWATGGSDGFLSVLDTVSNRVVGEVGPDLGRSTVNDSALLAAGADFVWVLNHAWGGDPAEIVVVDPVTREVVERIELRGPTDIWIEDGTAWVTYDGGVAHITPMG